MHPDFHKNNPFRRPEWRAERVWELVTHRPQLLRPRRYDDEYVRVYRRFLLSIMAAGTDEEARHRVIVELPHVYHAHQLHVDPDCHGRQILEARLLTDESFEAIAKRFMMDPKVIDCYHSLFFHVRDRLGCKDWITKVIQGAPQDWAADRNGVMTEDQRGYLYRLFAYYGGPLVLDTMISGMIPGTMPARAEDVGDWLDGVIGQILRTRTASAVRQLEINRHNVMHLVKLALRQQQSATASTVRSSGSRTVNEPSAAKIWKAIEDTLPDKLQIEFNEIHPAQPASAAERTSGVQ